MSRGTILFALALLVSLPAVSVLAKTTAAPVPSPQDKTFLNQVAQEDRSEIDLARLALQKSTDARVKQYAQAILSADTAMEQKAQKLARVRTPLTPNRTSQATAEYRTLSKLRPAEFDRQYLAYEAAQQQQLMRVLKSEASTTDDANVMDFAIMSQVPIQDDSRNARQVAAVLGGTMTANNSAPHR